MNKKDPDKKNKKKTSEKIERFDRRLLSELDRTVERLNRIGESVFGQDFYGKPNGSEEWNKLAPADRSKLRIAFALGVVSNTVIQDMEKNPILIGIAIGPGPLGTVIALGLMLSYTFRWDARAKEVRQKIREMLDKGILLEDYHDVLVPQKYDKTKVTVDTGALIRKKFNMIKDNTLAANKAFLGRCSKFYSDFKRAAEQKINKGVEYSIGPVFGKTRANKISQGLSCACNKAERGLGDAYNFAARHGGHALSWVWRRAALPVLSETTDAFKTLHSAGEELAAKMLDGIEFNKKEIESILNRFGL